MYINEFVGKGNGGANALRIESCILAMERAIFKRTFLCSSHLYILKLLF